MKFDPTANQAVSLPALLVLLALLPMPAAGEPLRLSEPVSRDAVSETFGQALNEAAQAVSLGELLAAPERHLGKPVRLQTRIAQICQKKGCFFIAQQGARAVRISFKDYGFFLPTDSAGKTVTLTGQLVRRKITAEQARHFAEDLRQAAPAPALKAGVVYEFIADAVRVPLA